MSLSLKDDILRAVAESNNSLYEKNDIKYKIDTAIQLAMYYAENHKECWNALLDAQVRLYKQFGIKD